jgi:hypothetical protein
MHIFIKPRLSMNTSCSKDEILTLFDRLGSFCNGMKYVGVKIVGNILKILMIVIMKIIFITFLLMTVYMKNFSVTMLTIQMIPMIIIMAILMTIRMLSRIWPTVYLPFTSIISI